MGRWPHARSGPILEAPGETWRWWIELLHTGTRGLAEGYARSDADATARTGAPHPYTPRLQCKQILAWVDAFHRREGTWPNQNSGPIPERRARTGERWMKPFALDRAGFESGLASPVLSPRNAAFATGRICRGSLMRRIWSWAKKHHQRTGRWPTGESGPVVDAPGETWKGIHVALRHGCRGFPVGHSPARLLAAKRGVKPRTRRQAALLRAGDSRSRDSSKSRRRRNAHSRTRNLSIRFVRRRRRSASSWRQYGRPLLVAFDSRYAALL